MNTGHMTIAGRAVDPRPLGVLGVPTSAGSHNGGQEKAPAALRSAGLVEALAAYGADVKDFGDLPTERHRPVPRKEGVRDLDRVMAVARRAAARVAEIGAEGRVPLVLGGDCTITLGVVAGLAASRDVGLVYLDGDADLNTPTTSGSGVLDTMGMTHLLGDGLPALAGLGPRRPLLGSEQVVLFGFDPGELDAGQWQRLAARRLHAMPAPVMRHDPSGMAEAALALLENSVEAVLVHFDVDVLDTGAFPLANFPHFAGLTVDQVAACLARFCTGPQFAGLVVTEVNPDHDTDGALLATLVETLARAITSVPPARD